MTNCVYCNGEITDLFSLNSFFKPWQKEVLCRECQQLFRAYQTEKCCKGCGRQTTLDYCMDCQKWQAKEVQLILENTALYHYDQFAKDWISRYKFKGDCNLAWMLVKPLNVLLKQYPDYLIVPIPSSKKSFKIRQFKAVEYPLQLAGVHYENLLQDIRSGKKQSEKTREERLLLDQPFEISGKITSKNVLLVDDVYTTGTTLHRAAELLKENNVISIKSVTFFR